MILVSIIFAVIGLFVMLHTIKKVRRYRRVTAFGMREKEVAQLFNSMW